VEATSTAVATSSSSAAQTAANAAPRYFSEFVNILVLKWEFAYDFGCI
jgi:hypothetical protein